MLGLNGADSRGVLVVGSSTRWAALVRCSRPQRNAHSNLAVKRASIRSNRSRVQVRCSSPGCAKAVLLFLCGGRPSGLPLPVDIDAPGDTELIREDPVTLRPRVRN
jgi:hypothetical protein